VASRLIDVLVLGATGFFCLELLKDHGAGNTEVLSTVPPEADLPAD
jgi:hypothetical protein